MVNADKTEIFYKPTLDKTMDDGPIFSSLKQTYGKE